MTRKLKRKIQNYYYDYRDTTHNQGREREQATRQPPPAYLYLQPAYHQIHAR
jgi:hypothetical protein